MPVCLKESFLSTAEKQLAHRAHAFLSEVFLARPCHTPLNNLARQRLTFCFA